ncbi:hypothetical protein KM92DES2_12155 [uncultured Desulfovibrio sp.]|uniref:Uncharacterized protein n=1 Tax=uncultured Desulfovibrio sp. TaxID=167968 RepID=A0A212K3F7_9BACT|nr:hypothetical protein KM92DES2_12155 [uncultured Desulfovibrio sp.]
MFSAAFSTNPPHLCPGFHSLSLTAPNSRAPQKKSTPPPQTFGVFLTLLCNPRACAKGRQIYGARGEEEKGTTALYAAICK